MTLASVLLVLLLGSVALLIVARMRARAQARALDAQREAQLRATWDAHQRQLAADAERQQQERYQQLIARFGQPAADRILRKEIWQGMTEEMLVIVVGRPEAMDETVMKAKTRRVLKYDSVGADRYLRKFTTENGILVRWDEEED
jgi:regulator of protease activity HflC (stomatin/prohibitin superfamily)